MDRLQSKNRRPADVVAPGDAALCLPAGKPLACPPLLMRGDRWLAAKLHAICLGVGAVARGALDFPRALKSAAPPE
jgi:hypothetical protein